MFYIKFLFILLITTSCASKPIIEKENRNIANLEESKSSYCTFGDSIRILILNTFGDKYCRVLYFKPADLTTNKKYYELQQVSGPGDNYEVCNQDYIRMKSLLTNEGEFDCT